MITLQSQPCALQPKAPCRHGAGEAEEEKKEAAVSSAFVPDLEVAIKVFVERSAHLPLVVHCCTPCGTSSATV